MKLIIGLGNPGTEYTGTRHNIGFEIISEFAKLNGFPDFTMNTKFTAEISRGTLVGHEILLVRPQAFMNLSGEAIRKILDFYKLTPDDIVIVHDDLDIILGKYKIATDSSSAGHNGVQNIIEKLGTQKFKRIRIGIREEATNTASYKTDAHSYVLGKFSGEEREKIKSIFDNILSDLLSLL